jgi:iron complex outermembrane receptor protein
MSYSQNDRDGYTRVLRSNQLLDSVEDRSLRLQLTVKPTANITSNTMIDVAQDSGSPNDPQLVGVIPSNSSAFPAQIGLLNSALAAQQARGPRVIDTMLGTGILNLGGGTILGTDTFDPARCPAGTGVGLPFCRDNHVPKQKVDVKGFLNNTAIDLGGVTLKNILSYRQTFYHTDMSESVPSSIFNAGIQSMFEVDVHQASDELQLSGKALDDKLDWIGGAYFSKETGRDKSWAYQFAYGNGAVPAAGIPAGLGLGWTNSGGRVTNRSKAIFAQGDYKFNDQWKLTAGLRKTWDDRSATSLGRSAGGRLCASFNPATGFTTAQTTQVPNCYDLSVQHNWSAPTWNLSLAYQADPDTMFYGTMRKGYNTGGFSVRAVQLKKFSYDPEVVRDTELGIKADGHLAGMPVRTNAAIFNSDYTNQQLQTIDTTLIPGTVITGTANVGKSRIYGGELEFTILPTHALELGLFASYVKAQYLEYPTQNPAGALVDVHDIAWGANGGNTGIPHWQGGLTGKYTWSLEDKGTLVFSADVTLRQHTITNNDLIRTKYPYLAPQLIEPGYGVVNLRTDWKRIWGSPTDLTFFVNNAGDKTYITGGAVVVGAMAATYAPPRMFGAELTYHFGDSGKSQ